MWLPWHSSKVCYQSNLTGNMRHFFLRLAFKPRSWKSKKVNSTLSVHNAALYHQYDPVDYLGVVKDSIRFIGTVGNIWWTLRNIIKQIGTAFFSHQFFKNKDGQDDMLVYILESTLSKTQEKGFFHWLERSMLLLNSYTTKCKLPHIV